MARKKSSADSKGSKHSNKNDKPKPPAPKRRSRKKKSSLAEALEQDPESVEEGLDKSQTADNKSDDAKSDDAKSDDAKSDDAKSGDAKSDDAKSDDDESDDDKSDDDKSEDAKSDDDKSDDDKSDDDESEDAKSDDDESDDDESEDAKSDDDESDDDESDDDESDDDESEADESKKSNQDKIDLDALYRLDADLLEKIDLIVSERKRVFALIENTRERASKVKTQIFSRVISDYQRQLGEIEEQYQPIAEEISQSLMAISALEVKLREDIDAINDRIVEMRFRCEVGEFSEEDLFPLEEENRRELKHLNKRMDVIDETYDNCRPYLQPEKFEEATGRPFDPRKEDEDLPQDQSNELHEDIQAQDPDADDNEIADLDDGELVNDNVLTHEDKLVGHEGFDLPDELEDMDIDDLDDLDEIDDLDDMNASDDPMEEDPLADIDPVLANLKTDQVIDSDVSEEATHFELWPEESLDEVDVDATMAAQVLKHYIVHKAKNGIEQPYPLGTKDFSIGRNPQNDLTLSDRGVSRRHARVVLSEDGQYSIRDLSSGNGIYINGKRVNKEQALNDSDLITIGKCKMVFLQRLE